MPNCFCLSRIGVANRLVAHVELALVAVGPLLRRVVRCVVCARAEVHEERTLRSNLLGIGDHPDGAVDEVLGQVVVVSQTGSPVRRRAVGLIDELLVLDQVRVPLVGLSAEEAVIALKTAAGRPVPLRRGHVRLVLRAAVPLAQHVRVVATLPEHLGDRRRLERNVTVGAGEPGRRLADARHADSGVVTTGQHRRASRRTQRCRVELVVAKSALGEPVHRRRLDRAAER